MAYTVTQKYNYYATLGMYMHKTQVGNTYMNFIEKASTFTAENQSINSAGIIKYCKSLKQHNKLILNN